MEVDLEGRFVLEAPLLNLEPSTRSSLREVQNGLQQQQKELPSKFFYDAHGSQLFDQICELEEYYVTRSELRIMRAHGAEMGRQLGPHPILIEFGSGSSVKSRILLDHLVEPAAYVPVDISRAHLHEAASTLARAYPHIPVRPVCADFTTEFELPELAKPPERRIVYLPGSTIGNFELECAKQLLCSIATMSEQGGGLLIGIDLQKDASIIERAYNDGDGVTAEFNLNLLRHINRELDSDFELDKFTHAAEYNHDHDRIEMSLVSLCEQIVTVGDEEYELRDGESICTEYSHKYSVEGFSEMAADVGLQLQRTWTDDRKYFAVLYFSVVG